MGAANHSVAMSDLVERLRMRPDSDCREAADEIERLRDQLVAAEVALTRAGWTRCEGLAAWKPPIGPSASPLLDRIDALETQLAAAEANLKWTEETNGKLIEQVGELQDRLEAKGRARRVKMPKWQPIETAPVDGTEIVLGWLPNGPPAEYQVRTSWHNSRWVGRYIGATHWRPLAPT